MTRRFVIEEPCEHGQVIVHGVWSKEKEAAFLAGADPDDPKFDCPGGSRTVFVGVPEELVELGAKADWTSYDSDYAIARAVLEAVFGEG